MGKPVRSMAVPISESVVSDIKGVTTKKSVAAQNINGKANENFNGRGISGLLKRKYIWPTMDSPTVPQYIKL